MTALDRDAAREKLWPLCDSAQMDDGEVDAMLDALEACVRPAPPQTIDRDALEEAWDQGNATGLDGWIGPNRGAGDVDQEAVYARRRDVDRILALLRPVEGVVLTREEARTVAAWYTGDLRPDGVDELALARRLEAAS